MESIETINQLLLGNYGLGIDGLQPRFRVVWTTDQLEKRYDEFNEFSEDGNIFLRTVKGVHLTPKYYNWQHDMWVMEELRPTIGNPHLERVVKFSYEPVWIFGLAKSERVPIWRACRLLAENKINCKDPNAKIKSPQDLIDEEEAKIAKEKELYKTMLKNESSDIQFALASGAAVSMAGLNGKVNENVS